MSSPQDRRSLISPDSFEFSDASTLLGSSPTAMPQQRHGYKRKNTSENPIPTLTELEQEDTQWTFSEENPKPQGLGITGANRPMSIARKPVSGKGSPQISSPTNPFQSAMVTDSIPRGSPNTTETSTPGSVKPFLRSWQRFDVYGENRSGDLSASEGLNSRSGHVKTSTFRDELAETYTGEDESSQPRQSSTSIPYKSTSVAGCPTKRDIILRRRLWLSITLLILSCYSTVMSFLWLVTASMRPRWGRSIYSGGTLTPSSASLLTALFAKTIELSFVTVFVGFLGQALSRRSIARFSKGVTIAEMSMRTWVIQPGFMLTHYQTIWYVGWSFLGVLSFIAAVGAMLYTTASDALVSPKLKFGDWENIIMQGLVQTSYGNPIFIRTNCQTPITADEDADSALTCLAIENAGQSYYNYLNWMSAWASIQQNGTGETANILERPQAVAMLYDNTTVQGSWVMPNSSNMTASYEKYKRIVNNVTMSMPHAGIFAAARDSKNNILQPSELDGVGGYSIKASVPSPAVNVLCVNMAKDELAPLVYTEWPNTHLIKSTVIPTQVIPFGPAWTDSVPAVGSNRTWLNSTVADDIFGWGEIYTRRPPIFPLFPIDYNTILPMKVSEDDSVYILAKSPNTVNYTLCSLRSFLYPNCSTQHDVSGTAGGSALKSHCEDPNDKQAYALSVPNSPITLSRDWVNLAHDWALSISLDDGEFDANSSNARLLTQLVAIQPSLPTLAPSMAEALAVLVGSTLLLSTTSAAFVHYWEYQSTTLKPGDYQTFNASVSTQQYTSGYAQAWQSAFYPILVVVALINAFCFVYYWLHSGLVTDYTEPQNLFALAINSPRSDVLAGSCGAGPERHQFETDWVVKEDSESSHWYIQEGERWKKNESLKASKTTGYELSSSPGVGLDSRMSSYTKLSHARSFL